MLGRKASQPPPSPAPPRPTRTLLSFAQDGIDYAAVTVQLPGGERVPFLFTVKELTAKGTGDGFGGEFVGEWDGRTGA